MLRVKDKAMRALFPGSFDPVTNGHLDIVSRVAPLVDTVLIAVSFHPEKSPIFSEEERVAFLRDACRQWSNVEIHSYRGLVVEAAKELNASFIIRGVRGSADIQRETQMAQMNRALSGIETLLLPASPNWEFLSSSLIKEVARFGGDVSSFVQPSVVEGLRKHFQGQ